jgi:putative N6-adenine-specific DNA methylase
MVGLPLVRRQYIQKAGTCQTGKRIEINTNNTDRKAILEKRIKRHVIGRERIFFAATSPGLEDVCVKELESLSLRPEEITQVDGGVEFKGRLQHCYLANLNLRTANRILMHIKEFRASNFRQLSNKLDDLPWELFLLKDTYPRIEVSSIKSRLYHKAAIAERIHISLENHFRDIDPVEEQKESQQIPQNLFVRVVDDRFQISIDSSGELLYKRGIKRHGGRAPMRETMAAAALMLAGYDINEPLIDPMCGTGTFSIEAAMIALNIPPGLKRDFAFMAWPSYRPAMWTHMKKQAEKLIDDSASPMILASDKDRKMCSTIRKNLEQGGFSGVVKVVNKDFKGLSLTDISEDLPEGKKGLIILNPPYGMRIGTKAKSRKLLDEIFEKLENDFKGWKLALFVPHGNIIHKIPFKLTSRLLDHGGTKLVLLTGTVS